MKQLIGLFLKITNKKAYERSYANRQYSMVGIFFTQNQR